MILFVPYNTDIGMRRAPIANWVIIALNLAVFLMQWTGRIGPSAVDAVCDGGWNPLAMLESCYLHGGVLHLLGNMLFLWTFGNPVNAALGDWRYVLLYHAFGIVSSAAMQIMHGQLGIGASGALSGIVGVYAVLFPLNDVRCYGGFWFGFRAGHFGEFSVAGIWLVAAWIAWDLLGVVLRFADGIGHWAHLGGFAAGIAAGFALDILGWTLLEPKDQTSVLALLTRRHEDLRQADIERGRRGTREELLKTLKKREAARPKAKPVDDDAPIPLD